MIKDEKKGLKEREDSEVLKNLIKLNEQERELIELRHKYKIEELAVERENNRIMHERDLETIRIKSAEISRSQLRREVLHK